MLKNNKIPSILLPWYKGIEQFKVKGAAGEGYMRNQCCHLVFFLFCFLAV